MDEQQRRIQEDLGGALKGEVRCDPLAVALYSSDGSLYQIPPLGVAFPRDAEDVITLARYASETNLPLIARGAGTGVAGQAIGSGLVVDFSRHMRRIESIGEKTVRVQPGVVRNHLNDVLREHGRYFPPDPSNTSISTVGSMLAIDAAGSHSVRVGSTRDHVSSIQMALAGGQIIEAENESLDILKTPPVTTGAAAIVVDPSAALPVAGSGETGGLKRTIISKLAKLLADNAELILERQPPLLRNCCGYYLRGILSNTHLNLARMLVGSEGTLGLFTAATLHTAPLPAHRGVVLLLFGQIEAAVRAVQEISPQQPSACDLLDRRLLSLAREADPRFDELISPAAEAALIVEQTGFNDRQVRDRIRMVIDAVRALNSRAVVAREAYSFEDVEFLWSLPSTVVPLLVRLKGQTRPQPFVEDVVVPPEALHEFLLRAQKVFQKHEVTASLYAHAAAGQLHLRPFLPPPKPEDGHRIEAIARDLYQTVFAVGGTISGEHGDGLSRTAFIRSQYGPLYKVFQQIKDIFDPHNLMNPGKIISDDPHLTMQHFRPPAVPAAQIVGLQLRWSPEELAQATARCNGCGVCKTQAADTRMCPFFRIDPLEEASPRAKANVMRNYISGGLSTREFTSPEMKRLSDLCFNCKQCQLECPANVNIPQMMIEAKAAYVAAHGLSRADWILARAHSFGALGCTASLASNWAINNPAARWLLENLFGIARQRKLPLFARRSFLRSLRGGNGASISRLNVAEAASFGRQAGSLPHGSAEERRVGFQPARQEGKHGQDNSHEKNPHGQAGSLPFGGAKPVVYFVDYYANYHDPELARAFVAILRHNGIPVLVPRGQTASGMAMISAGDLDAARDLAEQNVRELAELAREGHAIVCTEPAAALCLKQEYPMLLDHPDVGVVASQVIEAGHFLLQLHQEGGLRTDFGPLDLEVGYHTPCHLKALGAGAPLIQLSALIPGLKLHRIDKGCSGMAGAFGLTRENFRTSIRIGWDLIAHMRNADFTVGATECSSCKMQMEQGTTRPTLHPLKLLALSYGLMPEIRQKLNPASKKLVVT